ncbi:MAG: hypothetical protein QOF58_7615 [Pseudonocardiales bacterium]|jgi:hypothetical protein|nr:hypothetical protein [Pseudonocardiales bacterium]
MRRCRAAFAVLTLVLFSLLVAGPAQAGGPTSVLLVVPGAGQTASLYMSDADYGVLAGIVGAFEAGGGVDRSDASHESGAPVTVTWLIHDVQVWRVDRIHLGGEGGPWISTQLATGKAASIWDSKPVWHTAAHGRELTPLLDRLGVSPDPGGSGGPAATGANITGGGIGTPIAPPTAAAGEPKPGPDQASDEQTDSRSGWVWGLAGLGIGVAFTMAAVRRGLLSRPMRSRLATAEPSDGPVDEMRDSDPGHDSQLTWSPTDELSWPVQRR